MRSRERAFCWAMALSVCLVSLTLHGAMRPAAAQSNDGAADLTILIRASNLSDVLRDAVDAYAHERQITVEYIVTAGSWPEHYEQMLLMHVGGLPFDVTFVDQTYVPNAAQGVLRDLTPFIERESISLDEFDRWVSSLFVGTALITLYLPTSLTLPRDTTATCSPLRDFPTFLRIGIRHSLHGAILSTSAGS